MLEAVSLHGRRVSLVPLGPENLSEVVRVAAGAPEVWRHMPYPMGDETEVRRAFEGYLARQGSGLSLTWVTQRDGASRPIGGTTLRVSDPATPSVEIGGTWIVPDFQRTFVNTEVKLLQLTHAFESLKCARVEFKTDVRNERSQRALARMGATREGTLRAHMRRPDGTLRDSVYFSVVATEWPEVKAKLEALASRSDSDLTRD